MVKLIKQFPAVGWVRADSAIDENSMREILLSLYFTALQNGNYSTVKGYDFNNPDGQFGLNFAHALVAVTNEGPGNYEFEVNGTSNIIMPPGFSYEIRVVGVANFEADDLSSPFYLTANVPDSDGNIERFIYTIE